MAELLLTGAKELVYSTSGDRTFGTGFDASEAMENKDNWGRISWASF
jgi:hypothetical protein